MNQKTTLSNITIQHLNCHKNIIYIENEIVTCNTSIFERWYRVYIVVWYSMFSLRNASKFWTLTRLRNFFQTTLLTSLLMLKCMLCWCYNYCNVYLNHISRCCCHISIRFFIQCSCVREKNVQKSISFTSRVLQCTVKLFCEICCMQNQSID